MAEIRKAWKCFVWKSLREEHGSSCDDNIKINLAIRYQDFDWSQLTVARPGVYNNKTSAFYKCWRIS
jgi:hypothetical protein